MDLNVFLAILYIMKIFLDSISKFKKKMSHVLEI